MQNKKLDTQTVSLSVSDGIVINNIPWTQGMNVQMVLEAAYNLYQNPPTPSPLSYWIEYFGTVNSLYLGYYMTMIDGTSQMGNNYWFFYINQVVGLKGIDDTIVDAGDQISFKYEAYAPLLHVRTLVHFLSEERVKK